MVQVATDKAEGAQALFCYIADAIGSRQIKKAYKPYLDGQQNAEYFFTEYNDLVNKAFSSRAVDTINSKNQIKQYVIDNKDWFMSSLTISQYIIETIDDISIKFRKIKRPGWQDMLYKHGDDEIMDTMAKLFKSANKQYENLNGVKYFGNINKWSPADIYFATDKAKKQYKKLASDRETRNNNLTFAVLNKTIADSIESGDLLPLSLKKVNKKVYVQRVNFSREKEEELLADTICTGVQSWSPMKIDNFKYTGSQFTMGEYSGSRDIRVTLESGGKKGDLQFRHTPASSGRPSKGFKTVLSYKGASALGGQVVGIPLLCAVLESVDKAFAQKIQSTFDKNYKKFEKAMNKYNENGGIYKYKSKDKVTKKEFNDEVGAISAQLIMNPLRTEIDRFFSKTGEKRNNAVRALFAYTASRTENSSPFVIAKD